MSLVFDALRQQGTQTTQAPTEAGSVVTPSRRRLLWAFSVLLLCLTGVLLITWTAVGDNAGAVEPSAPTEPLVAPLVQENAEINIKTLPEPAHGSRLPDDALVRIAEAAPTSASIAVSPSDTALLAASADSAPVTEPVLEPATAPIPTQTPVGAAPASTQQLTVDKPETALTELDKTPVDDAKSPINPADLLMAFNAALGAGQLSQAEEVLERARLALGNTHLIVARMQGYYCMRADCPEQARQAYSTILSRLPRDREAGYNLAVLDWQAGRRDEAHRRVRTLLSQHPGDEALRALQRQMGAP